MLGNRRLRPLILASTVFGLTLLAVPCLEAGVKYKVLYSFKGGSDGGGLYSGPTLDAMGNVYGVTSGGGAYGYGTAFELTPVPGERWGKTVLYSFCSQQNCTDGALPKNDLILSMAGDLYGAAGGGVSNSGVVFALTPGLASSAGWSFRVIYDGGSEGALVIDEAGSLYGEWGPGKYKAGDIFELTPGSDGWTESVLYSFCAQRDCGDGDPPEWGLAWDAAGNLYGTTEFGGGNGAPECSTGCGVVYQVQAVGRGNWKYHVLHRFAAFPGDGLMPQAGVTLDSKGNVYGTTLYAGNTAGTVFELSPQQDGHWKETILYDFPNPEKNGGAPVGGVTFDNKGNLYGTASAGGDPVCDCGVVFKMTPRSNGKWSYTVLHRFKGPDGIGPGYNLIFDKSYEHLYGTAVAGGSGGYGVVYEITP
jgi:hypothetical protein